MTVAEFGEYTVCDVAATTDRFVVYRATDRTAKSVFIKVTRSSAALGDVSALSSEFALARGFDGIAAIPRALRMDSTRSGQLFQVREDVPGSSLEQRLATSMPAPSIVEALLITLRVLEALRGLHERGIAHCDLRPANLLYDADAGIVRIIDLSLARPFGASVRPPVAAGPHHAPEQSDAGGGPVDARTDYFALGVILCQLLTGAPPVDGQIPAPVPDVGPDRVPRQLRALVAKLVAVDPAGRYASRPGIERDLARAIREWRTNGAVSEFPLGTFDEGGGVQFPREALGCHGIRTALRERFWAAADGTSGMVLVAGGAGSGKSTLLADLDRNVRKSGAVVATGGWSEMDQNVPFRGLAAVSRQLVEWWRGLGPAELAERQEEIRRVVGGSAGSVTEVFPELEAILGPQTAPVAAGSVERQNQLVHWLGRLLDTIGRAGRPLVLLLEDLHWADASSLKVLERLTAKSEQRFFLVVGTFRTTHDGPRDHPELAALRPLTAQAGVADTLFVPAFQSGDTEAFLERVLDARAPECAPLAGVLNRMSLGNPLMLRELLASLVAKNVIRFEAEHDRWSWQLEQIEASRLPDDVAKILADRLAGLTSEAHDALGAASCVRRRFDAGDVAALLGRDQAAVRAHLDVCERAGFITGASPGAGPSGAPVFVFRHDRVQQACYRSVGPQRQQQYHATLGAALLEKCRSARDAKLLFEALAHLNRCHSLGDARADWDLARLNLEAALEARTRTAYDTAARLLRVAADLLPGDAWRTDPALTQELFVVRAECEYLSGEDAIAQELYRELLEHVHDPEQRAAALLTRMKMRAHEGRFPEAIDDGLACLDALGIHIPARPRMRHVLGQLLRLVLRGRLRVDDSAARLATLDRRTSMIVACLAELWGPAFWVDDNLTAIVIFTMVRLSQRFGNAAASSIAYSSYGAFLAGALGLTARGKAICRFGVQVADRAADPVYRGRSLFMYTGFFAHHEQTLEQHLAAFRALMTSSRDCGDYPYAGAASLMFLYVLALGGKPVREVLAEAREIREIARQTGHDRTMIALEMLQRWAAILEGRSEYAPARFKVDIFAPGRAYENERGAFYLFELTLLYLLEDYPAAEAQVGLLIGNKILTGYFRVYHAFVAALLLSKLGARSSAGRAWRGRFRRHCRLVEREAKLAPRNYLHKAYLLRAVAATQGGRHAEAARWFEQAESTAREHGFPHHAAIAAELAADYHDRQGNVEVARRHILNARLWYQEWGCLPRLGSIDRRYAGLLAGGGPPGGSASPPASGPTGWPTGWPTDLGAVLAASRALSEEVDVGRLVDRLMTSMVEHTSASRAVLLTRAGGELIVERDRRALPVAPRAEGDAARDGDGEGDGHDVPRLVVNYVDRLKRPVLLARARDDELFGRDPYFANRPTAAVLCLSLARMNESLGVLFLEKEHGATFRHSDLMTAEILGAQAAATLNSVRERDERLAALQTQMNPHFLFNALNGVAELSVSNPAAVERAVLKLSELYRSVLESSRHRAVPLQKELELVEAYLALEKMRFADRLSYRIETEGAVGDVLIPPLLVQPLVENGVNHGIAWNRNGGAILVQATVRTHRVHVRVTDTGGGSGVGAGSGGDGGDGGDGGGGGGDGDRSVDPGGGLGMGLPTIRRRLELFFGPETELTVTRGAGVAVDMYFPRRALSVGS